MAQFGNSILPLIAQEEEEKEDEKIDEETPLDDDEGDKDLSADDTTPENL